MSKEEIKFRMRMYTEILRVGFRMLVLPTMYMFFMWAFQVVAAFLFFKDFWRAAGFVSAIVLYQITSSEFNKEFFGRRNAIQKQG